MPRPHMGTRLALLPPIEETWTPRSTGHQRMKWTDEGIRIADELWVGVSGEHPDDSAVRGHVVAPTLADEADEALVPCVDLAWGQAGNLLSS